MRVVFLISVVVLSFVFTWACINNQKTSDVKERSDNIDLQSGNVIGEYLGSLPCVDCEAINTLLEVRRDNSYKLTYTYEGKSDDTFVKQGFWKINKNRLELRGVDYKYKISDDKLFQLDLSGNEITGDLAEKYQLARIR